MASYDPDRLQTERPEGTPIVRVKPKLSREEVTKLVRKYNPDITNAAVEGEVDNIERESSGVPGNDTGDHGTSGGMYQHHLSRLTNLKAYAEKQGKSWTDPEIQVQFSRYEKEHDYPSLLKLQQTNNDRSANEDAFKRIFERPASVLWQNNAEGKPVTEGDKFKFSDYAMKEFMDQPDTQIRFMDPAEYLKLTPPMEGKPWQSPSGRSLKQSIDKGEPIEQIPSLDVSVDGPTAKVTDQDGRHRMLAAQENGIQAVPVAVKGLKGEPTEIVGHDGVPQAFDHPRGPRQEDQQPQKEPISLLRQIGDAIIPRAEAAEPTGVPEGFKPIQAQQQAQAAVPEGFAPIHPEQTGEQKDFVKAHPERFPPAGLTDDQQRAWMAENNPFSGTEVAKGAVRGGGPYVAGAGVGAGIGGAVGGPPGAAAGAAIGAGTVAAGQLASGVSSLVSGQHVPGPQDATNALLDLAGINQPKTFNGRMAEAVTGGVASGLSGAGGLGLLSNILKNPASKVTANYLTKLASRATTSMADNPLLQAISGGSGGGASQLAAEAGLPPWAQFLAGLAGATVPVRRNLMPNLAHQEVTPLARQGIEAGFVLHPADAAPAHTGGMSINDFAMAEASKIKSNQLASARNGIVANGLAQEEIGLPRGTDLTPAAFKEAKQPAIAVFREVEKAVPEVDLGKSPTFTNFVKTLGARTAETEKLFPEMAGTPAILELRDQLLRNERASTPAVMEKIADLRKEATTNFHKDDAQSHRLGMAQRQAAQAMEEAMEDSVKNAPRYFQEKVNEARAMRAEATADFDYINKSAIPDPLSPMGKQLEQARRRVEKANADTKKWEDQLANAEKNQPYYQGLPDKFRQARQLFAKIYDVESVTNKTTGDVNARGLARLLEHGKPLTGNLKLIADMANAYAKAFQNPAMIGGVESMSVLDAAFGGMEAAKGIGKLAAGNPWGLTNLGLAIATLAKKPLRGHVMSPAYQKNMIAPQRTPTLPASVLTTPFLPTQPVPGNPGGNALMGLTTTQ
jgi:hypothetical protein